ncbi:EAL domain-containing protein [Altererythrobacter indicus]|uniref:EAL domain-containing protein n=1 Tax=Altericroceibacterium indicum TaxID=374177 RepID=A0A845A4K4_9SPHN|nr:EAL domain-containing protein [Altericroceibacterium indicum]MXP24477.1 EAL domain-containing protein [Altericroceibacterium indicum]
MLTIPYSVLLRVVLEVKGRKNNTFQSYDENMMEDNECGLTEHLRQRESACKGDMMSADAVKTVPINCTQYAQRIRDLEAKLKNEKHARHRAETLAETGLQELRESQKRLALLQIVTEGANRSSDVSASLKLALSEICEQMGWAFGCAYLVERSGLEAVGCDIWYARDPQKLAPMIELSRKAHFSVGESIPGLALSARAPVIINHPSANPKLLRFSAARQCGLVAACAFPIWTGEEIAAVIEFSSFDTIGKAPETINLIQQIGTQLGRVIERERSRQILLREALHDPLTGLANRLQFSRKGEQAFAALRRDRKGLAVIAIDLDGFKAINDCHGHAAGDAVLVQIARSLQCVSADWQSALKITGKAVELLPARIGGDEFVIMIRGDVGQEDLAAFATLIHDRLRTSHGACDAVHMALGTSIGIAQIGTGHVEFEQLLRDADLAMYQGKADGGGQAVFFTVQLGNDVRESRQLLAELQQAPELNQLILYYQPIVDVACPSRIIGFEALVRWDHPVRGLLEPGAFIPVAEAGGVIGSIGGWVLEEAICCLRRFQEELPEELQPVISVNIAAAQFLDAGFENKVIQLLRDNCVHQSALTLEVTESVALVDPARTARVLNRLRKSGVRTSLDDFGTGYSSLSYLKNLPFDTIKIDRSFIQALANTGCRSIVRAILDIADSMNLKVVAEGIETTQQCETVRLMGVEMGQGYLFGRPMPERMAIELLTGGQIPDASLRYG